MRGRWLRPASSRFPAGGYAHGEVIRLKFVDDATRPTPLHGRWLWPGVGSAARDWWAPPGRARVGPAWRVVGLAVSPSGLLIVGTLALLAVMARLTIDSPSSGLYLLLLTPVFTSLLAAVAMVVAGVGAVAGRLREHMVLAALHERCCPGCAYDLSGVGPGGPAGATPNERGGELIRCPECGSAWLASRRGSGRRPEPIVMIVRVKPSEVQTPAGPEFQVHPPPETRGGGS